ncbi:MAG TPA: PDZ domain-containing protein [Phycisphaerae bacterium]|nr:PDZ domain-containing protein [Phycisphaerae bacterium]HQE28586.1 PDZ domain-containing protein [Phycisphaerae bacterium]
MNRTSGNILRAFVFSTAVSLFASAAAVGQVEVSPTTRPVTPAVDIERLLEDLTHPSFKVREAATAGLKGVSDDQLPRLIEAFHAQRDHEARLRLRSSIEHVFYRRQLNGRMGFLGVQPRVESLIYDPVSGRTVDALVLSRVLPGFPAEAAGLKTGDMLLEFEGRAVADILGPPRQQQAIRQANGAVIRFVSPSAAQIEAFTNEVSRREPGSTVRMRVLRLQAAQRRLTITIADEPARTLEGANLLLIAVPQVHQPFNDLSGPPTRYGLCVTAVTANSPAAALGLERGDVIVGLGPTVFGPTITTEQFQTLLAQSQPGSSAELSLWRVEQVNVAVTLGGRPVERMNPNDMEIAQTRFAEWWRAQTGEPSLRTPLTANNQLPRSATAPPDPTVLP